MPPRRPRSAVATAPLKPGTGKLGSAPLRKSTTAQLRLPPSRRRKAARLRGLLRGAVAGLATCALLAAAAVAGAYTYLESLGAKGLAGVNAQSLVGGLMPLASRENVLLLGTDYSYTAGQRVDGPVRSDTMMVASMDPASHKLSILSVPRDTRVPIRGRYDKINSAYALGGPGLAMSTVSSFLGVPIHHFAQINTTGLERLVDVVGGVRVYVEKDMYYVDETAHLGINIHKGWHQMSGKQAHQYVRFRHDELGDIGRVQRQQRFLRAASETMLSPKVVLAIPQLLQCIRENIHTDLDGADLMRLGVWSARLSRQDVKMVMLPGEFTPPGSPVSYWLPDVPATRSLAQRLLAGGQDLRGADRSHVKLTVLNGTQQPGAANAVARTLRQAGWNVWSVGDAPQRDLTRTRVVNEQGQDALAAQIGRDLGLSPERIDASVGDITTDFTVVVGADWARAGHHAP